VNVTYKLSFIFVYNYQLGINVDRCRPNLHRFNAALKHLV